MWERILIEDDPEWEEYQMELPRTNKRLRVWKEGGKWRGASLGYYVSGLVDTKEEAQKLCEDFAIELLLGWMSAITPAAP